MMHLFKKVLIISHLTTQGITSTLTQMVLTVAGVIMQTEQLNKHQHKKLHNNKHQQLNKHQLKSKLNNIQHNNQHQHNNQLSR